MIWLYYLNPLNYAFRAVVVSEFSAPHWDQPAPSNPSLRAGTAVLQANGLNLPTAWMWGSVLILIAYIFVINVVVVISLELLNGRPCHLHCAYSVHLCVPLWECQEDEAPRLSCLVYEVSSSLGCQERTCSCTA